MTLKLPGYRRQRIPGNEDFLRRIRVLTVNAVYARWNETKEPSTLLAIFYKVQNRIHELKAMGQWSYGIPGKRTIDRRVNEAADPRFYHNRTPKIVAVQPGVYQPNPQLFS